MPMLVDLHINNSADQSSNEGNQHLFLPAESGSDLKMIVAGISGWSVASGRRKNEKQRLLNEDLQRLSKEKNKSWRWVDNSLEVKRDNNEVRWNKPIVQTPVIAREIKNQRTC